MRMLDLLGRKRGHGLDRAFKVGPSDWSFHRKRAYDD
jgi:hypothetical protein